MALESGSKLGHYDIVDPLGKGGMGEVYRARDTKLGREVAVKVLPGEFSRDAERLARLEREARMLAALNHPNIAAIYGLEQSGGTRFLVLELVEGEPEPATFRARPGSAIRLRTAYKRKQIRAFKQRPELLRTVAGAGIRPLKRGVGSGEPQNMFGPKLGLC